MAYLTSSTIRPGAPLRRSAYARLTGMLAVALLAVGGLTLPPPEAEARKAGKVRQFEGRVVAIDRSSNTFVQRRARGRVRIKVRHRTRFQDLRGFRKLRKRMYVQTKARHNGRHWVAWVVDRDGDSDSDTDSDRGAGNDTDTDTDSDSDSD